MLQIEILRDERTLLTNINNSNNYNTNTLNEI